LGKEVVSVMGSGMMHGMYGGMGFWWLLNAFFIIFVIVGIALLVVWIVKQWGAEGHTARGESAMDVLKKRYARGEITKDEFDSMKKDIL
jgi:putative membrane protein